MSAVPVQVRIDKFLWCVRLCKTRSQAVDFCVRGRVRANEREVKPAYTVAPGDALAVRVPPIWKRYRVLAIPGTRVGAKQVPALIHEITPWEDLEKADLARRLRAGAPAHGAGRPSKKARRDLDRAMDEGDA